LFKKQIEIILGKSIDLDTVPETNGANKHDDSKTTNDPKIADTEQEGR
jgi:hypothetical protein